VRGGVTATEEDVLVDLIVQLKTDFSNLFGVMLLKERIIQTLE
jgi:hypothetical protein